MVVDLEFAPFPTVGLGVGIYLFFKGFRGFRKYRLMADTPVVPIRSLAMGRAEIYGTARGDVQVLSPVSNTACYWYKVDIWKHVKDSKGNETWSPFATDINGVPFDLEDATGKVRVNPSQAELDLKQQCKDDRYADAYTESVGKGTAELHFVGASRNEESATDSSSVPHTDHPRQELEDVRRQRRLEWRTKNPANKGFFANLRLHDEAGMSGHFRMTEYCIIPGQKYHISGTCAENPKPRNDDDRNLICKGESEPFFHISMRTEEEDQKRYRRRAFAFIFGGAVLSVVCLGILLESLDWF